MAGGRRRRDGGSAAGRIARTGLAAAHPAALTLALLAAAPLGAQPPGEAPPAAEPPGFATFTQHADALHVWATTPDAPPRDWAPADRERFVLWLADYATGSRAAHAAVAARTPTVLADVCALLPHLPALDRERLLRFGLGHVERLERGGAFEAAHALLRDTLLPLAETTPGARLDALLAAAEVARRSFRWPESEQALAVAATIATTPTQRVLVAVNRGLLQLERGLPDRAFADVAEARAAAAGDRPGDAWAIAFLELRLAYATGRPELARAVLRRVGDDHGDALPPSDLRRLEVRAAMTLLQEPAPHPTDVADATRWLRTAADDTTLWADERRLALAHLVLHALTAGDHAAAARDLDAAEALASDGATIDERALLLPTLRLRWALDAAIDDAALARHHAALRRVWHDLEARWADEPLRRSGLGPLFLVNRQRALGELLRAALRRGGAAAALELWLGVERHGSMARAVGAEPPPLPALQRPFAGGRGALVFASGPEHGLVLAIDGDGVHATPLPTGTLVLERRARDLLRTLAAARAEPDAADALRTAAAALRDALLPPTVRERLQRWHAVALVGADLVGDVPFELLPFDDGRLLGATHAVAYLPSLVVGAWLDTARPVPVADRLAVELLACPDAAPRDARLAPQVQRLPWDDRDRERLRRTLCDEDALTVRTGADAHLAHRRAGAVAADLFAVIAHGVRDEARLDPQGILLGDGEVAWPADFERTPLPRHAVFAACRAGRGRLRRGDDGRHLLSGSALLAGARAVVVPSLDVGYVAAKDVLAALHTHLAAGAPFEQALRRARIEVGGARGERSFEPFLFHLHGLGDRALVVAGRAAPATPTTWWPVLLTGAALTAVGLALVHRRRPRPS